MIKDLFTYEGKLVKEYTLKNEKIEVSFINIGACITKFIDVERNINIIISHEDYKTYLNNPGYLNSIVGRNAGRIKDSLLYIDDKKYELSKNFLDKHQLHGGFNGFSSKYFEAKVDNNSITFTSYSKDLEDGFPGDVNLSVTYKLVDDELHIIYEAISNKKTILNFTNHSYFNLNKNKKLSILNHKLSINADNYLLTDEELIPYKKSSVKSTVFDFTKPKTIGEDIHSEELKNVNGYDLPYIINKSNEITNVASLFSPESNLILDVYSNQDALVLYTGNYMDDTYNINNGKGYKHCALCLECQGIPNSCRIDEFKTKNIYDKNQKYTQKTIYKLHK